MRPPPSPEKRKAREQLRRAVKRGVVVKPSTCEVCGGEFESRNLDGHHRSGYDNPLDVAWLCKRCHGLEHGGALKITDEQRRAGVRTRLTRQTPERRSEISRKSGSIGGPIAMRIINGRRTPEERQEAARRAAAAVPRDRVGGRGKKRGRKLCETCGSDVNVSWFSRHQASNCELGTRRS